MQPAARRAASTRAVTGKPEPRPNRNEVTAPALLGAGASGENPPSAQTSGGGRHSGRLKCSYLPPAPAAALCGCRRIVMGPKTLHPRQPSEYPTAKGDKGATEKLLGAECPESPPAQAQNERTRRGSRRGVRTHRSLTQKLTRHSPMWSPRIGGAQGAVSPGALHTSGPTSTSLRCCRRRLEGREPSGLCLAAAEALHARPSRGRRLGPRSPPARAGPHRPSVFGERVAAAATAKGNAAAVGVAATTTAWPGARRGLMLSSPLSPPLWASRASAILHFRAPSPTRSRPTARAPATPLLVT